MFQWNKAICCSCKCIESSVRMITSCFIVHLRTKKPEQIIGFRIFPIFRILWILDIFIRVFGIKTSPKGCMIGSTFISTKFQPESSIFDFCRAHVHDISAISYVFYRSFLTTPACYWTKRCVWFDQKDARWNFMQNGGTIMPRSSFSGPVMIEKHFWVSICFRQYSECLFRFFCPAL